MKFLPTLAAVYISAPHLITLKLNHLSNMSVFYQVFWYAKWQEVSNND